MARLRALLGLSVCLGFGAAVAADDGIPRYDLVFPKQLTAEERRAQDAERERRDAAERQRRAAFEAAVDAQAARMGGNHRRAEAERFVRMREAAEAAKPPPPPPKRQCEMVRATGGMSTAAHETREAAVAALRPIGTCARGLFSVEDLQCERRAHSLAAAMPAEARMAKKMGIQVDPATFRWTCSATFVCEIPKEVCKSESSGPARASAQ